MALIPPNQWHWFPDDSQSQPAQVRLPTRTSPYANPHKPRCLPSFLVFLTETAPQRRRTLARNPYICDIEKIIHNLPFNYHIIMKTNLSSQITLNRVSTRYYRPENAFERSVLTRLENTKRELN